MTWHNSAAHQLRPGGGLGSWSDPRDQVRTTVPKNLQAFPANLGRVDLIRQARVVGRARGDARVRRITGWVSASCVAGATVIGLLLPGGSASAAGPTNTDPPTENPSQTGNAAPLEPSHDEPSTPDQADVPSAPPPGTPHREPTPGIPAPTPRRHHNTIAVLQPPQQAPVRAPRVTPHSRSGAS